MNNLLLTVLTLAVLTISLSDSFAGISAVHDRKGTRNDTYEHPYQLDPNYLDPNSP
jgi:hypothetical protein